MPQAVHRLHGDHLLAPFGQDGGPVEVDETYIGFQKGKAPAKDGHAHKMKVLSLVERNSWKVRSIRFEDTALLKSIRSSAPMSPKRRIL